MDSQLSHDQDRAVVVLALRCPRLRAFVRPPHRIRRTARAGGAGIRDFYRKSRSDLESLSIEINGYVRSIVTELFSN